MIREIIHHRDLLWLLTIRELRIRYARAALGAAWALFGPVVMMGIFTALDFERLIADRGRWSGIPYPVFAYVGLLFWTHLSASLTQATPSLVIAGDILRKSAFPREVIPLAKVFSGVLDLAIGVAFLSILMAWTHRPIPLTALMVPLVFLMQLGFTVGLALLLSAANLFFRDVNYLVQAFIVLAMFASSVVYPVEVSRPFVRDLLQWNPVSSFLDCYRECLLLGEWRPMTLLPAAMGTVLALVVGVLVFRKLSSRFAEEV